MHAVTDQCVKHWRKRMKNNELIYEFRIGVKFEKVLEMYSVFVFWLLQVAYINHKYYAFVKSNISTR